MTRSRTVAGTHGRANHAATSVSCRAALLAGLVVLAGGASCTEAVIGDGMDPRILWRVELAAKPRMHGWAGIPATDGRRFFTVTDSGVSAFEVQTGRVAWSTRLGDEAEPESGRLVARDGVVFVSQRGALIALDAASGAERWRARALPIFGDAQIAADGRAVYAVASLTTVGAFAADDGKLLWSRSLGTEWGTAALAGLSVSGDTVYGAGVRAMPFEAGFRRGVVIALDARDGRTLWEWRSPDSMSSAGSAPTVAGPLLLVSDQLGGAFFALDRFTGRRLWRVVGDTQSLGPADAPLVAGDTVFVASNDRQAYAVQLASGRLLWRTDTGGSALRFALCGPLLLTNLQQLAMLDRRTGRIERQLLTVETDARDGSPTSGFAVAGEIAFVAGTRTAVAVRCR